MAILHSVVRYVRSCGDTAMGMTGAGYVTVFLVILLSAACATRQPVSDYSKSDYWKLHQHKLTSLTAWDLTGRFSLRTADDGWSASLIWHQQGENYKLRIIAPFGRGSVDVSGEGGSVTLTTAENRVIEDQDIDAMLEDELGWKIPLSALLFWIKGLPEPDVGASAVILDNMGRISDFDQSGWTVRYDKYTTIQGYDLPVRITIQRDSLRLRLSINKWTIPLR